MSGKGGSSPSGYSTTTTSNKTSDTQLPYLTTGWDAAKSDMSAGTSPAATEGYNALYDTSTSDKTKQTGDYAVSALDDTLNGNYTLKNSPAYSSLYDLAYGTNTNQKSQSKSTGDLYDLASEDNKYVDTSGKELTKESNGDYLNSNPYIDKAYDNSAKRVTDIYETATAPDTDSTYESAGRYGSGAQSSARSMNEKDLGYSLDKLASDYYYKNYNDERDRQQSAAKDVGELGLGQQKLQGSLLDSASTQYGNAANTQDTAASNLQTGYDTGNKSVTSGLAYYPTVQKQTFYPAQQEIDSGLGLTDLPYRSTGDYLKLINGGGTSDKSGSTSTPYYSNTTSDVLGTGLGATSLYNNLGGSSLLGKGGSTGAAATGAGAGGLGLAGFSGLDYLPLLAAV